MTLLQISKMEEIEDGHPGLCRQVEAMFKALIPLRAIAAALEAQYGVRIGPTSLREFKWECCSVWGKRFRSRARRWRPCGSSWEQPAVECGSSTPLPALVRAATA